MDKNIKESIKECIENGLTISYPLKTDIYDCYGTIDIRKSYRNKYMVYREYFDNLDKAIDRFCENAFTSKNYHNIITKMRENGFKFSEDENLKEEDVSIDMEYPTDDDVKLFQKYADIVDEEAKISGIIITKIVIPKIEDYDAAVEVFDYEIKELTEGNLYNIISRFIKFHENLKPLVNIVFCYINSKISLNFEGFSSDMLKTMRKSDAIHIFDHMEINLSFGKTNIIKNYKLDL